MARGSLQLAFAAALFACGLAVAAPVSPDGAVRAAEAWRGGAARHFDRETGAPSGRVRTFSDNGTNLFHLVELDGGGFAAVAADDVRPPVMAFSPTGELPIEDDGGPLWAMLAADASPAASQESGSKSGAALRATSAGAGEAAVRGGRASRPAPRPRLVATETIVSPVRAAVRAYAYPQTGISSVGDVRVAPLVESKWDQMKVGGKYTYNYYTTNHWYCGCVATAMAQLLRFHRFPTASVAPQTFTCYVTSNAIPVSLEMKGGVYDWDQMPLKPAYSITDTQREAIGRICYDAGVSARMQYTPGGSGTFLGFTFEPLKSVFGYESANGFLKNDSLSADEIQGAVLANLDAGYPVLLSISGASGGHAIVADGYGYEGGTLWCHLNMGWSGSHDVWYALPDIQTGSMSFTVVNAVVYNVFPTGTGQLVTGRVTDDAGNPVEGATVTATYQKGSKTESVTAQTAATGIYSFRISAPSAGRAVSLSAAYGAAASSARSTSIQASNSPYDLDWETGSFFYPRGGLVIGNSWGNDLAISPADGEQPSVSGFTPASQGGIDGFALSFGGTGGARYEVQFTTNLAEGVWSPYASILVSPSESAEVFLPIGEGPAGFWRVMPAE